MDANEAVVHTKKLLRKRGQVRVFRDKDGFRVEEVSEKSAARELGEGLRHLADLSERLARIEKAFLPTTSHKNEWPRDPAFR